MSKKDEGLTGHLVVKRTSFWDFLLILAHKMKKKQKVPPEVREESAKVKALNKQISALEKINDSLLEEIDGLTKAFSGKKSVTTQDKLIDIASNLFLGNNQPKQQTLSNMGVHQPPIYESGREYTDHELKSIVSSIPKKYKKTALTAPFNVVAQQVRQAFPDMSDTSINRALEMVKEES
jgi:hypothetical protein